MSDPAVEALWKNVLDNWEDDRTHGVFLGHCQRSDQLVEAAVRYRSMKGNRERGAIAEKRLQDVTMLAMAQLDASRGSDGQPRRRSPGAVLFLLATLGLLYLLAVLDLALSVVSSFSW